MMKKVNLISGFIGFIFLLLFGYVRLTTVQEDHTDRVIKVGFVYDGDESTPYSGNFLLAQEALEKQMGDQVITVALRNVPTTYSYGYIKDLCDQGCDIIFSTSYNYGESAKRLAMAYPNIQFCQATCSNAGTEPVLENYHTFMGEVHQGRYICGVIAGMKLRELILAKKITPEQAKVGYVGAFPYAEVISGYTAFFLGIRSVVPEAVMSVRYTNTWSNYATEKKAAKDLIGEGCVIISQHSDTIGPAVACEEASASHKVYHVGYNQSMLDVAPSTSLISCRINWIPYIMGAVEAVRQNKPIEELVPGHAHGNDIGGGIGEGWIEMLDLNTSIAAKGSDLRIDRLLMQFRMNRVSVFQGNYIGVDPEDENDTWDLHKEYRENLTQSAPSFHYILQDCITVES